jgi:Acyltransferase family
MSAATSPLPTSAANSAVAAPASVNSPRSTLDALVDATPSSRDRAIDGLRALCITVVVLWHWVFSITHRNATGSLTMPNPLDTLPLGWLLTWFLQPMPIFFLVGGFANMAMWESLRRSGAERPGRTFLRRRLPRLVRPTAIFAGVTLALHLVFDATERVTLVPLWFMGVYLLIVLVAPMLARLDERFGRGALVGLVVAGALSDVVRFGFGISGTRFFTTALAWTFCHQLGLAWRSGNLTRGIDSRHIRRFGVLLAGVGALSMLTLSARGIYEPSMVTMRGQKVGNLNPSTFMLLLHAMFQTGLVLWGKPLLDRLFAKRGAWMFAVRVNAMAMTIFCWHMTALIAAIAVFERLGGTLGANATASWWSTRPLWVAAPGLFLGLFIAVFGRFERPKL